MVVKPIGAVYRAFGGPTTARPTTDFFTSNPSLLHHLPRNPKLAIVQTNGSPAGGVENGATSGSSRQGWGAGSGGGYTGHARAFMALQHSAALDPSVALSYNAEEKRRRRNSLLAEHRLSRKTEVVDVETAESMGRTVHRQIEARAGSRRVGVVEIEPSPRTEVRSLEDVARGSIPYPSQVGASPSRSSTPYIGSVSRSHSSVEVWRVGIPQSRRASIRAMSTRSSSIALPDVEVDESVTVFSTDTAVPSIRVLGQPNRVLMDLAGVDVPGRPAASPRRMLVRRNSTAAIQQTPIDIGAQIHQSASKASQEVSSAEADEVDKAFYQALYSAFKQTTNHQLVYGLVQLYRIPRTNSSELQVQSLKMGVEAPLGYSTATYNLCLDALLRVRRTGQSIQPFLEIYNEMLANDCLPNLRTYSAIIRCLTAREQDVWASVTDYAERKKWQRYRAETFGKEYDFALEAERDAVQEGYKQEGNFESAIRMFRASTLHRSTDGLAPAMKAILEVAVDRENTKHDIDAAMEVYEAGVKAKVPGWKSWKGYQLELLGKQGDKEGLEREWEAFHQEWKTTKSREARDWLSIDAHDEPTRTKRMEDIQRRTWLRAAKAFLSAGDVEKALQIWNSVQATRRHQTRSIASAPYPSLACNINFGLQLVKADPHKGMKFVNDVILKEKHPVEPWVYRQIVRTLISGDQLDLLRDRCCSAEFREATAIDIGTSQHLYAYTINKARTDPTAASRALFVLSEWCRSKAMLIDMDIIRAHAAVIAANEDWSTVPSVLYAFRHFSEGRTRNTEENKAELYAWARDVLTEWPIGFVEAIKVLQDVGRLMDMPQDDTLAIIMARKYLDHRVLVLADQHEAAVNGGPSKAADQTPLATTEGESKAKDVADETASSEMIGDGRTPGVSVSMLQQVIRLVSEYQAEDGDIDDVLVFLANDMATIAQRSPDFMHRVVDHPAMRQFARKLAYRVGEERALELTLPFLGEFKASSWTTLSRTAPVVPAAVATPELSQGETASETGASATSAETPSSVVDFSAQYESGLKLSVGLGNEVNRHTYRNAQVSALDAYGLLKKRMASAGEVAPPEMLGRLLDNLSRVDEEDKVRELYALSQHVIHTLIAPQDRLAQWTDVENKMLIAVCHLGHLEEAGACRARLLEAGQTPSADAYATMIASAKDTTDETHVARSMFDEARAMGVQPNLFLFNTIISKMSRARKADEALELFKAMKMQGIRPSSVTYGAVINACTRVGDGESAETLFNEMMSQRGFRIGVPPINTMMQFHVSTQPNREKVLHYFRILLDNRLRPTAHTYKVLLDAYGTLAPASLEDVKRVFEDVVRDPNVRVQGTHWASLIGAYGLSGQDVEAALEAFDTSSQHPYARINLASEPVVWEAILAVLAERGTVEQMEAMRERMVQTGARSTAYVYNVLIRGYARAGMIDRAREIFESMGDSVEGVAAPNNHPQLLTSSGHVKPSTVSPQTSVVYREPSTYEAMVRAEVESGSRDKAQEVVSRMETRRYPVAVFLRARSVLDDAVIRDQQAKEAAVLAASALGKLNEHCLPVFKPRVLEVEQEVNYDPTEKGSAEILQRRLAQDPAGEAEQTKQEGEASQ